MEVLSIVIAGVSLGISLITAYLTQIQPGRLKMTPPTKVILTYEGVKDNAKSKIWLRTLLYNTSNKGRVIENLFVKIYDKQSNQVFGNWSHGTDKMTRGSGLFIPNNGVLHNHEFINIESDYTFQSEEYWIKIYATVFERKRAIKLYEAKLILNNELKERLSYRTLGVIFDWNPDLKKFEVSEEPITQDKMHLLFMP